MKHINIDGAQNVEVSRKLPSEKTPARQLDMMERYTEVYRSHLNDDKSLREVKCLEVIYPGLFRHLQKGDLIAGRLDFLPIGGPMSRKRTLILESRQILPILRKISSASSLDSGAHYPLDPFLLPSSKESISDSSWLKAHQSTRG